MIGRTAADGLYTAALTRAVTAGLYAQAGQPAEAAAGLPLQDIAQRLGYSVGGLRDAAERGAVGLDAFNKAIVETGQRFGRSVDRIAAETQLGSEKRVEKAWDRLDEGLAARFGYGGLSKLLNDAKASAIDLAAVSVNPSDVPRQVGEGGLLGRVLGYRSAAGPAGGVPGSDARNLAGAAYLSGQARAVADAVKNATKVVGDTLAAFARDVDGPAKAARRQIEAQFGGPGAAGPLAAFQERLGMIDKASDVFG
jgi:hypothetical protein